MGCCCQTTGARLKRVDRCTHSVLGRNRLPRPPSLLRPLTADVMEMVIRAEQDQYVKVAPRPECMRWTWLPSRLIADRTEHGYLITPGRTWHEPIEDEL
jgi:hypothetical protein